MIQKVATVFVVAPFYLFLKIAQKWRYNRWIFIICLLEHDHKVITKTNKQTNKSQGNAYK